jgi:agmatine deiminase
MDSSRALGYRMPAEWEPHAATWIAWPHNRDDWPGKFSPIPWVYTEIVRHLTAHEDVYIFVNDGAHRRDARERLTRAGANLSRVKFIKLQTDRVWTRDTAPSFVVDTDNIEAPLQLVDWAFNAWAKYDNYQQDRRLPKRMARELERPSIKPKVTREHRDHRVVLEGGSIDVNGLGTLLTTEECLLSDVQVRNPGLQKSDYESLFAEFLGARHVIWLDRGITGDDTHGHVDDLARFVGPKTVVTVVENDPDDANYEPLQENLVRLKYARDQDGSPLEIVTLPMPSPLYFEETRLPASYANFYIANGLVLVPTFNDPADREALSTLARLFPDRRIVGIHAVDLVWGFGTLHCMTREQPSLPVAVEPDEVATSRLDFV